MSDALDTLRAAFADPLAHAREVAASGSLVVGYTAPDAPVELLVACGLYPVLVSPSAPIATPLTKAYLADTEPWHIQAMIERLVDGACRDFVLIIISRPHEWLYYMGKEFVRIGSGQAIPPLHMLDLVHQHDASLEKYNHAQFDALVQRAAVAGHVPTADSLREASRAGDRRRKAITRILELREAGRIDGVTAIETIGASFVVEPHHYASLVDRWLAGYSSATIDKPRLLLIDSEPAFNTRLHGALEAGGALVVAEDSWLGSRAVNFDHEGRAEHFDRLFVEAMAAPVGEVSPREVREDWLMRRLASGEQDGVVFYMPPTDRQLGWDYPRLKAQCETLDLANLPLREPLDADGLGRITGRCCEFVAQITANSEDRNAGR